MADETKNDNTVIDTSSKDNSNTVDTSQSTDKVLPWDKPSKTVSEPTNKGGDETMAKDPEGMFDYSGCKTYTVKSGDTLLDIAQQNNIALQQLRYFNHLNKATLQIREGQVIYIPTEPVFVPTGE